MSPPPSPHLDDEALSGVLDDTATEPERAHTESCRSCRDRLDQLRAVSRLVASPVGPPSAARRDAAINAALAAAATDRALRRPDSTSPVPAITRRAHIPAWIAAVAAAVLVVALAVPLLGRGGRQTAKSSSAAPTTARASDTSGLRSEAAGSTAAGTGAVDAAARPLAPAPELGAVADVNQLASAVRTSIGSGAGVAAFGAAPAAGAAGATATTVKKSTATTSARSAAAPACSPPPPEGVPVFTARVVWQGSPASVYGFGTLPPGMRVVVILDGSCATAATTVV